MRKQTNIPSKNSWVFTAISIAVLAYFLVFNQEWAADWNYNWKGIRPEIRDSAKLAMEISLEGNTYHQQHSLRKFVMDSSTIAELEQLSTYPDGNMRTMAYEALLRREGYRLKLDQLKTALNDDGYCSVLNGCIRERVPISTYIYSVFVAKNEENQLILKNVK